MRPRRCAQGQRWAVAGHEGWSRGRRVERGGWTQSKRWSLELGTSLSGKRDGYSLLDEFPYLLSPLPTLEVGMCQSLAS